MTTSESLTSLAAKVRARVQIDPLTGCWNWSGNRSKGYGQVHCEQTKRKFLTHRVMVAASGRDMPVGMDVDHLCRNRACCNPDHLEVVTHRENIRRGNSGLHRKLEAVAITHCPRGHEYTPENTLIQRTGWRKCRACGREFTRRYRERMAGEKKKLADAVVTDLYRRFKEWSLRGFGPDDVTWCEVKADVEKLIEIHASLIRSPKGDAQNQSPSNPEIPNG